jgi:hypothetical protein
LTDRADYGLKAEDAEVQNNAVGDWLNVDDSYEGISENPINLVLAGFKKEWVEHERRGYDAWQELNKFLVKFSEMVNNSPYYADMDIIKLVDTILDRYHSWMTISRQNVILGKEKMIEGKDVVDKAYVTLKRAEVMKDELGVQFEQNSYEGQVIEQKDIKFIIVQEDVPIETGSLVIFKKGRLRR